MPNSGKTGDKRKNRPSGQDDKLTINVMEIQNIVNRTVDNILLESRRDMAKTVYVEDGCIKIKAYNNKDFMKETLKVEETQKKKPKESDGRGH